MARRRGRDRDGGSLLRQFVRATTVRGLIRSEGVNYCTNFEVPNRQNIVAGTAHARHFLGIEFRRALWFFPFQNE